jgi:hypothetical protein
MNFFKSLTSVSLLLFLVLPSVQAAIADDDDYVPEDGTTYNGKGKSHGSTQDFFLGQTALRDHQIEKAITYLRRSVNANGTDLDARAIYATALEEKYRDQEEKDPQLFRECLSQWLYVLKTIAPEESGVSVLKFLYKDEERDMPAKQHIKDLTGTVPKHFESNDKFLARVCKGDTNVSGTILKPAPKDAESDAESEK